MANNDFFAGRQRVRTDHHNGGRAGTGGSSTVISITSEISDIVEMRRKALSDIASQIAIYGTGVASGNIDAHNTQTVRNNLDSLIKAAKLTDAEAKEVLSQAITKIVLNV